MTILLYESGVGRSIGSITMNWTGPWALSSRSPSCSCSAVEIEGASEVGAGGSPAGPRTSGASVPANVRLML